MQKPEHVLITGASGGIGYYTALELAKRGASLWLAGRSRPRHDEAIRSLVRATGNDQIRYVPLDLADLDSVRACAAEMLHAPELDMLINNAGIASVRGATKQGFELAFGTNHLGHFLLTNLLLPRLRQGGRIIHVSSTLHRKARNLDWHRYNKPTTSYTGMREYAQSKLANALYCRELSRRYPASRLLTFSLHPGRIETDVYRRMPRWMLATMKRFKPMKPASEGWATTLHCASLQDPALHGRYFDDCAVAPENPLVDDAALAAELWHRSEAWVAQ